MRDRFELHWLFHGWLALLRGNRSCLRILRSEMNLTLWRTLLMHWPHWLSRVLWVLLTHWADWFALLSLRSLLMTLVRLFHSMEFRFWELTWLNFRRWLDLMDFRLWQCTWSCLSRYKRLSLKLWCHLTLLLSLRWF